MSRVLVSLLLGVVLAAVAVVLTRSLAPGNAALDWLAPFAAVAVALIVNASYDALKSTWNQLRSPWTGAGDPQRARDSETPSLTEWKEFAKFQRHRLHGMPPFLLLEGAESRRQGQASPDVMDPRLIDIPVVPGHESPTPHAQPRRDTLLRRVRKCLGWQTRREPSRRVRRQTLDGFLAQRGWRRYGDPRWLLLSEGGSGKSVALHRLAHRCLDRAMASWRTLQPIPLYVRLQDLEIPENERPTPAAIRSEVLRLAVTTQGGHRDEEQAQRLARCLDWGRTHGRWLLILDGFDEIRAIQSTAQPQDRAREYGSAIGEFARAMGGTTVLASRPFPAFERAGPADETAEPRASGRPQPAARFHLTWGQTLGLRPLEPGDQDAVLRGWFPQRRERLRVQSELREHDRSLGDYLLNPLYLAAICLFRSARGELPRSAREAFQHFVDARLDAFDWSRAEQKPLPVAAVKQCAARIALELIRDQAAKRIRDHRVLAETLSRDGWSAAADPATVMQVLHDQKLARSEGMGQMGRKRYLFLHQRVMEHFAIEALLALPGTIDPAQLLANPVWREVTVGVLEGPDPAGLEPLYALTRERCRTWADTLDGVASGPCPAPVGAPAEPAPGGLSAVDLVPGIKSFPWPEGSLHLLGILQSAAERGAPADLDTAVQADRILCAAFRRGWETDQAEALKRARAGTREGASALLAQGLESEKSFLVDIAFEQTLDMPAPPPEVAVRLIPRLREAMVARWAVNLPEKGGNRTFRQRLERFDSTGRLSKSLGLLRIIPWVDTTIYAVAFLSMPAVLMTAGDKPNYEDGYRLAVVGSVLVVFGLFAFVYWPLMFTVRKPEIRQLRLKPDALCRHISSDMCVWRRLLSPVIRSRVAVTFWAICVFWLYLIGWTTTTEKGEVVQLFNREVIAFFEIPWALNILWLCWGAGSILAAVSGRMLEPWKWPLWPVLPVLLRRETNKSKRRPVTDRWQRFGHNSLFLLKWLLVWLGLLMLLGFLGEAGTNTSEFKVSDWVMVLSLMLPGLGLLALESRDTLALWRLRCASGQVNVRALLAMASRLFAIRGNRARLPLLQWAIYRADIDSNADAETSLTEAIDAIARDRRHNIERQGSRRTWWPWPRPATPRPEDGWTQQTRDWYRSRARRGSGLAYLAPLLGDLISLRERVRRELERDSLRG